MRIADSEHAAKAAMSWLRVVLSRGGDRLLSRREAMVLYEVLASISAETKSLLSRIDMVRSVLGSMRGYVERTRGHQEGGTGYAEANVLIKMMDNVVVVEESADATLLVNAAKAMATLVAAGDGT